MSARVKYRNPSSSHHCIVCGASCRRQWCRLHDPARRDRDQAHAERVKRARSKNKKH